MQKMQIGPLALAYLSHHPKDAAQVLAGGGAESIAALLGQSMPELEPDQMAAVLIALPRPTGAECLELLPQDTAAEVLRSLSIDEIAEIVSPLSVASSKRLLSTLRPAKLTGVRRVLSYASDSVGKIMHTNVVTLPSGISVSAARSMLPSGRTDALAVAFVLDKERRVKGLIAFQELATASGETELETLIHPAPPGLKASQHLAEARLLSIWQDHQYLPVVGTHGRFLGVLERSNVLEAFVDTDSSSTETDRDPIDLLLSIAETVWVPLAYLFGKADDSRHSHSRSEKGEK
jgi:Mg/Co/Ni transporter MgtE